MRRFLVLAVFVAGCGTESVYGQPAWTMTGQDAAAETSEIDAADAGADVVDSRADVGKDSRADTTADAVTDAAADTQARVCEPGRQEACACVGGLLGAQRCADDGMVWGECLCPDAASDSAIDVVADTVADTQADSTVDAPMDTGTDSGSVVDSGADAAVDAGPVECPGGIFVVAEPPTPDCELLDGSGRTFSSKGGLTWTAKAWARNAGSPYVTGVNHDDAKAHCLSIGMRLPTYAEAAWVSLAVDLKCGFPCGFVAWTDTPTPVGKHYVAIAGKLPFESYDTVPWHVMCVKP